MPPLLGQQRCFRSRRALRELRFLHWGRFKCIANVVEDEEQIPVVQAQAVSKQGDIWICGDHRIGCGNANDGEFVARVRDGVLADVSFVDPPYNLPISGFVSGGSTVNSSGIGEMSPEEFTTFLASALKVLQMSSYATRVDLRVYGLAARLRAGYRKSPLYP